MDFKIEGVEYEFPKKFRLGDWVLIEEMTGLQADVFAERFDEMNKRIDAAKEHDEKPLPDMGVLVGLIAVAVWQANPRWRRDRVLAFMQQIDTTEFEGLGGDDGPPAKGEDDPANRSSGSSDESTTTPPPAEKVPV